MTLSDPTFRDAVFPPDPSPASLAEAMRARYAFASGFAATFGDAGAVDARVREACLALADRGRDLAGRPVGDELLREIRAAAARAGAVPTDASLKWLREAAGLDLGRTAAVVGLTIADTQRRHVEAAFATVPPAADAACATARREFLGMWLDQSRTPAAVLAGAHRDTCAACAAAFETMRSGRSVVGDAPIPTSFPDVSEFAAAAERRAAAERGRRRLPWILGVAALLVVVALRAFRDEGAAPPVSRVVWWKAEIGAPALDLVSKLAGRGPGVPPMTATLGPSGQFHLAVKGWAFVPGDDAGPGELVPLPAGRVGHLGFDGGEAWWEAGDRRIRPIELARLEGKERAALGILDALRRVLSSVEAGTATLGEGVPSRLDGKDVVRHKVKLSPLGGEGKGEATLWVDAEGVPKKIAFGPVTATLEKLVPVDGVSPCAWRSILPDAVREAR